MINPTLRDAFWDKIYEIARKDRNVVVVSEDMGAPSLDKFRTDLPNQFINVGIAEQQGLLLASGMAMEGKRPFVYAIAPFVTLRCLEQIRVANGIMNIPVTLVGVGPSFGYDDSGPTHHLIEDIAVMRAFPNIVTHVPSDSVMSEALAEMSCTMAVTNYVRLDRHPLPPVHKHGTDFSMGFVPLIDGGKTCILACGIMVQKALDVARRINKGSSKAVGVIDLFSIPANESALIKQIKRYNKLVTLEEHFLPGGLGSYVLETLNNNEIAIPVKRIGLEHSRGYCYVYGGREYIHKYYGVTTNDVERLVRQHLRK